MLFMNIQALRFGLTIWPYGNTIFERGKVSFKCALLKAVIFFTSHAAEIAYFSSANRELSNAIGVMWLRQRKIVFPTIRECFTLVERPKSFKGHIFFVLGPILPKVHI